MRPDVASDADATVPRVWSRRRPINYPKKIELLGGISAPLLAGFSLAALAQLASAGFHPRLYQWTMGLLAVAAVLLIISLQMGAESLAYAATPSERLEFNPEASEEPAILAKVRERQWQEMELRARYSFRASVFYNLGVSCFLGGLGCLLVPSTWHPLPLGRLVGMLAIGCALVLEGCWIFSNGKWPKWLFPRDSARQPDAIGDGGAGMLFRE